jgi:hypothetical protein
MEDQDNDEGIRQTTLLKVARSESLSDGLVIDASRTRAMNTLQEVPLVAGVELRGKDFGQSATASRHTSLAHGPLSKRTGLFRWTVLTALVIVAMVIGIWEAIALIPTRPAPAPPDIPIRESTWDGTLVWFTITQNWKRVPFASPIKALRSDDTLWQQMYLRNWDTVPSPFREEALETMFKRYQHVLADPQVWDVMQAKN